MALTIGDTAPDFEADTTEGRSASTTGSATRGRCCSRTRATSPRSARPSSATWRASSRSSTSANTKIIGLSVDPLDNHEKWAKDIEETQGTAPNYPLIGDPDFKVAKALRDARRGRRGRPDRAHAGREPDRPQRVRDRPGQEDQADPRLSDDDRPQLRRGAARDRLAPAHRQPQGRDAGPVAAGRRRDHRRLGVRRAGEGAVRRAGSRRGPTSGSCRSRTATDAQSPAPGRRSLSNDDLGSGGFSSSWFSFIQAEKESHCDGSCQPNGLPSGGKKSGRTAE